MRPCKTRRGGRGAIAVALCAAFLAISCGGSGGSVDKPETSELVSIDTAAEVAPCGLSHCGDGFCDQACGESAAGADFCQADCCVCGDGECQFELCGEAWDTELKTCATDCAECGNGSCDPGEGPKLCSVDCCGACGDGICKGGECGEGPETCDEDCGKFACGDGVCDPGENPVDCVQDCEPYACGNGACEPGEGPEACPEDCSANCGDCECEGKESYGNCPVDCGYCGDGYCIGKCEYIAETAQTCVADCCLPYCEGKECGPDSCGGWCGQCPSGWDCVNGACMAQCQDECAHGETICFGQAAAKCGQFDTDNCLDWGMPTGCPQGTGCQDGQCICHPDCVGKECGTDGCGGNCGECGENLLCLSDGLCHCGVPCGEVCCSDGEVCTPEGICCQPQCEGKNCGPDGCGGLCGGCDSPYCVEGKCQQGLGCATSSLATCGGCSCQACVCSIYSSCCQEEWDHYCTMLCATTCGGCDQIDGCGDGECDASAWENCGSCPSDCKCPADTACNGQECLFNHCAAGVDLMGCCQGDTVVKCVPGGMYIKDCALEGAQCGWVIDDDEVPGYFCGNQGWLAPEGDPSGVYPLECPNCVANCVGKECGDDGCDGKCGQCDSGLTCFNGACADVCVPSCWGKNCGDDGCGGSCGDCGENQACHEEGYCYCPGDGCNSGCCPEGDVCAYGSYCCTPDCEGKTCGDNGCGGDCGNCPGFCIFDQCEFGVGCAPSQTPTCAGCSCEPCVCELDEYCCNGSWDDVCVNQCALDCGGCDEIDACGNGVCDPQLMENCGTCPQDCACPDDGFCHGQNCVQDFCALGVDMLGCCAGQTMIRCIAGYLYFEDCAHTDQVCGWAYEGSDLNEGYLCGDKSEVDPLGDPTGDHPLECPQCVANCVGKECGDDGCGGTCGDCPDDSVCFNGSCADVCIPSCEDNKCGDDGCGGQCEECDENEFCDVDGHCQCEGAGCSWGCCAAGEVCHDGACCLPQCGGANCGPDGCGWHCGDCPSGYCVDGQCESGVGCANSQTPTCGGCSCEECVCTLDPYCCLGAWDDGCLEVCAYDCGGCDGIDGCGNGECEPQQMENCGTCPQDCLCPESAHCHDQGCVQDFCELSVGVAGCCAGPTLIRCIGGGQHVKHCADKGELCGWGQEDVLADPSYMCGMEGEVDPTGDPTGLHPLECPQCAANCVGKECGDDGCGGTCGDCSNDLTCFNGACVDVCLPDCQNKNCGDDGCGEVCGECGDNQLCGDDGKCMCAGDWCEDECCPAGQKCFSDGNCHGGIGCTASEQPTCGECSCEECVCATIPECCTVGWNQDCAEICALLCGGCDEMPSCGDGQCQAELMENCGTCPVDCHCDPGTFCHQQECLTDYCEAGIGVQGCCMGDTVLRCFGELHFIDCTQFGHICGWRDPGEGLPKAYECGGSGDVDAGGDPSGIYSMQCPNCTPSCTGKECGDDGCGGWCGTCHGAGEACFNGSCIVTCLPSCWDKECGDDECGGSCGECGENESCNETGKCLCVGEGCTEGCCAAGEVCLDDTCCLPSCDGKECGGDGCGGDCGGCDCGYDCQDSLCVFTACEGKDCGGDGCGGSCGECPEGQYCLSDHSCLCLPSCDGKECGDDGCGGECGPCEPPEVCEAGLCVWQ